MHKKGTKRTREHSQPNVTKPSQSCLEFLLDREPQWDWRKLSRRDILSCCLPEKHMQVTFISGMLHVGRRSASIFPTSKFSCVITGSIPRPAGRKARLESRIEESHLLRQMIALFFVQETRNGSAHTCWRKRNHHVFCCICELTETAWSVGDDTHMWW